MGIFFYVCVFCDEGLVIGVDVFEVLEKNGCRCDVRVVGYSSVNDLEVIGVDDNIFGECF